MQLALVFMQLLYYCLHYHYGCKHHTHPIKPTVITEHLQAHKLGYICKIISNILPRGLSEIRSPVCNLDINTLRVIYL